MLVLQIVDGPVGGDMILVSSKTGDTDMHALGEVRLNLNLFLQ